MSTCAPHPSYAFAESPELRATLQRADQLRVRIATARADRPDLWPVVEEKLKIAWTTDSNAIEGSSLSFGDTLFFLKEGLTVQGKPLKDFLDARNHADAIEFLFDLVAARRPISEGVLKEINALLLSGVRSTPAIDTHGRRVDKPATPGAYKHQPNHVLQPDGTIHHYVDPLQVPAEMAALCAWIAAADGTHHPAVSGAVAHYNLVRIHPFDDGNGRGARLLMNLILIRAGFPPAVIRNEDHRGYLTAIRQADSGAFNPFAAFVVSAVVETEKQILRDLGATGV